MPYDAEGILRSQMKSAKGLPTYTEIARQAGVSTKTVCNVVGNPSIVRARTMEKVLATIRRMGIADVEQLRVRRRPCRLDVQKSMLLLVEGLPSGAMSSPVYAQILIAAEKQAHKRGWQFTLRHKSHGESVRESLANFRGQGVLLFGRATPVAEIERATPGLPCVRILGTPAAADDCDQVDYDRVEVCRMAARHLQGRGCRKVGFIGDHANTRWSDFLRCAREEGLDVIDGNIARLFQTDGTNQIVNQAALEEALTRVLGESIDGLFAYSDQVVNALYPLLARRGIEPDRHLQVVSCNAEELFLSPLRPRPTSIDIHSVEIGVRAVETLLWRIQNPLAAPTVVIIRPKLIPGEIGG